MVSAALRMFVVVLATVGVTVPALADAPTAYACRPLGTPDKARGGCSCPAGFVSKRDESNYAVCAVAPNTRPKKKVITLTYDQLLAQANLLADSDCAKAETYFVKALKRKANGIEALVGSGMCMVDRRMFASAHSRFRSALAVNPKYEGALWGVAEAYRNQGRRDDAINAYRQYLDVYPSSYKGRAALERLVGRATPPPVPTPPPSANDPWGTDDKPPPVAPNTARSAVRIIVSGQRLAFNGTVISFKPTYADIEAVLGKPDRVQTFGTSSKIHTWDTLGLIARETNGRVLSMGFPFVPDKQSFSPKSLFGGSILVDGARLGPTELLATIKARPGATQPYSARSVIFDRGDLHVFTIAKTPTDKLDLVELSFWQLEKSEPIARPTGPARTADVTLAVNGARVLLNSRPLGTKPMVADVQAILGKPDRVWEKKGAVNRIHTWDKLGVIVYEPFDGRAVTIGFPMKSANLDFYPKTFFGGTIFVDGGRLGSTISLADVTRRPGATTPYGAGSVIIEKGEISVYASTEKTNVDLVEVSFWRDKK